MDHHERRMAQEGQHYKWAAFLHFSALLGYAGVPLGFVLGPLAFWLWKRKVSGFVDRAGLGALNFQLTILICAVIFGIVAGGATWFFYPFSIFGIIFGGLFGALLNAAWVVVLLVAVIQTVVAGVQATRGEQYVFLGAIRIFEPERERRRKQPPSND